MKGLSAIANNPLAHLRKIASELDSYDTKAKIDPVLDELDFIHEMLDPEEQPMVTQLSTLLLERYKQLLA